MFSENSVIKHPHKHPLLILFVFNVVVYYLAQYAFPNQSISLGKTISMKANFSRPGSMENLVNASELEEYITSLESKIKENMERNSEWAAAKTANLESDTERKLQEALSKDKTLNAQLAAERTKTKSLEDDMKSTLNRAKAADSKLQEALSTMNGLNAQLHTEKAKSKSLDEETKSLKQKLSDAVTSEKDLRLTISRLLAEMNSTLEKLAECEKRRFLYDKCSADLQVGEIREKKLNADLAKVSAKSATFESGLKTLQKRFDEQAGELKKAVGDIKDLPIKVAALSTCQKSLTAANDEIKQQGKVIEIAKGSQSDKDKEISKLKKSLEVSESAGKEKTAKISTLEQQLKSEKNVSSTMDTRLKDLNSKLSGSEKDLKIEKDKSAKFELSLNEKEAKVLSLEKDLKWCQGNSTNHVSILAEKTFKMTDLEKQLSTCKASETKLTGALATAEASIKDNGKSCALLENDLKVAKDTIGKLVTGKDDKKSTVMDLDACESKTLKCTTELAEATSSRRDNDLKIAALQKDLASAKENMSKTETELIDKTDKLNASDKERIACQSVSSKLQLDLESIKQQTGKQVKDNLPLESKTKTENAKSTQTEAINRGKKDEMDVLEKDLTSCKASVTGLPSKDALNSLQKQMDALRVELKDKDKIIASFGDARKGTVSKLQSDTTKPSAPPLWSWSSTPKDADLSEKTEQLTASDKDAKILMLEERLKNACPASNYHVKNLASPSAGCHVVRELTSPTFSRSEILPNNYFVNLLGINRGVGVPEDAISDDISLGHCWPMKGKNGTLTLKLEKSAIIEAVTLEHLHPDRAIDIRSAPAEFNVYGFAEFGSEQRKLLVSGSYSIDGVASSQVFNVDDQQNQYEEPTKYVSLEVLGNHGRSEYTCIYGFRIHGRFIL